MIGRLKGVLVAKQPPWLVIDVGGVGYELEAPMSTFFDLPEVGREVSLCTHYAVKEDTVALYGFLREAERSLFRTLQKVSGVGAKIALSVLSGVSVDEFARLYLVPGMFHCFGGYGPSLFDMLSPLVAWVENGTAPEAIPAVELDFETGMPKRTRNLCAYPCVSRYCGSGDLAKAEAFDCVSE